MYLIAAATAFELAPFVRQCPKNARFAPLITGIGPVETTLQAAMFLAQPPEHITGVINIGVAGAYHKEHEGAGLLDICLAEHEVLGDLGICDGDRVTPFRREDLHIVDEFDLENWLLAEADAHLKSMNIPYRRGGFVTVSCVSGSRQRGEALASNTEALCENMEGAAIARVCQHFGVPLLELRCISNMVEQRDLNKWRLHEACERCGTVAAAVFGRLL